MFVTMEEYIEKIFQFTVNGFSCLYTEKTPHKESGHDLNFLPRDGTQYAGGNWAKQKSWWKSQAKQKV